MKPCKENYSKKQERNEFIFYTIIWILIITTIIFSVY